MQVRRQQVQRGSWLSLTQYQPFCVTPESAREPRAITYATTVTARSTLPCSECPLPWPSRARQAAHLLDIAVHRRSKLQVMELRGMVRAWTHT